MIRSLLTKNIFILSVLILLGVFLIARFPFFLSCFVPEPQTEDTPEYYEVVLKMLEGNGKVDFSFIPIGYPLFLLIIGFFSNTLQAVAIAQNILALTSCLLFIYSIYHCYPRLTIWSSFVFSGYIASENNIRWDSHFTPDSLYTSLLIFFSGFVILLIKKESIFSGVLAAILAAYLLLIRGSAIFIIPIMIFVMFFLFYNKYKKRTIMAFSIPFVIILLSYSAYNYYSINVFNFITTARLKKGNTAKVYPIRTNEEQNFINDVIVFFPPENEFDLIENSWNVKKVTQAKLETRFGNELYIDSSGFLFFKSIFFKKFIVDTIIPEKNKDEFETYKKSFNSQFGNSICVIKPKENKVKIKLLNFAAYFTNFTETFNFYENWWGYRYWFFYVGRTQTKAYKWHTFFNGPEGKPIPDNLREFTFKEMASYPQRSGADYEAEKDKRDNAVMYRIYLKLKKYFFSPFFRNYVWLILFIISFFISGYKLIASKLKDNTAFIVMTFCSINIGSALIFTFFSEAQMRYSFTTEFSYYAVAAFLPILINLDGYFEKLKQLLKA